MGAKHMHDFNTSPSTRGFTGLFDDLPISFYFNTSPSTRGFVLLELLDAAFEISIPAPPRGASDEEIHMNAVVNKFWTRN